MFGRTNGALVVDELTLDDVAGTGLGSALTGLGREDRTDPAGLASGEAIIALGGIGIGEDNITPGGLERGEVIIASVGKGTGEGNAVLGEKCWKATGGPGGAGGGGLERSGRLSCFIRGSKVGRGVDCVFPILECIARMEIGGGRPAIWWNMNSNHSWSINILGSKQSKNLLKITSQNNLLPSIKKGRT